MTFQPLPIQLGNWFSRLFCWQRANTWKGVWVEYGDFVWLQQYDVNPNQAGMFGKGSLSRGDATWLRRLRDMAELQRMHICNVLETLRD